MVRKQEEWVGICVSGRELGGTQALGGGQSKVTAATSCSNLHSKEPQAVPVVVPHGSVQVLSSPESQAQPRPALICAQGLSR